jgi:hypothetical protein
MDIGPMVQFDDELTDDFGRTLKGWIAQATPSKAQP